MLYYPDDVLEKLEKVEGRLPKTEADCERFARRMLEIDPDNGVARMILAGVAQSAGGLAEAERLAWEGLERLPNFYQSYLTVSQILSARGKDALAYRMFHFALWKMGMSEEVSPDVAEIGRGILKGAGDEVDVEDPMMYYGLAELQEEVARKEGSRTVEKRVLPFRLLNDLQRQAPDEVEPGTVEEILRMDSKCATLFYNSLRQMVREGDDLDQPFPLMLIAVLGEISGPKMVSDLLELADFDGGPVDLHACWALWRLGQRYPREVLRIYREAAPRATTILRGTLAEQLPELPLKQGVTEALAALLDDFGSREMNEDAETLLALVANGLIERNEDELARKVLAANTPLLSEEGRAWIRAVFEEDETFESTLMAEEIPTFDIHDICESRVYMDHLDEDLFEEDDDDYLDEEPPPKPKIGRNEPCWCGSGKKYKKCHLASDERGIAEAPEVTDPAVVDKEISADLAHKIIGSSDRWHTPDDLKRAKREYFGSDRAKVDDEEANGYLQWFAHDFRDSRTNKSLVEHMWESGRRAMSPRTLEILEAWRNSYAGVFEVMRADEGMGLELRNVTSDEILFVYDVMGSRDARAGEWLVSRLEFLDGRWQLVSDGFRVQPVLESRLLKYIQTEAGAAGETPDAYVRRNGNRLYRVLRRMGLGPVH